MFIANKPDVINKNNVKQTRDAALQNRAKSMYGILSPIIQSISRHVTCVPGVLARAGVTAPGVRRRLGVRGVRPGVIGTTAGCDWPKNP
jgi:hypothetical protein